MKLIPHYLLTHDQTQKATGVWRDLRRSLGRCCHTQKEVHESVRVAARDGAISVWDLGSSPSVDNLYFETLGGVVDLFSTRQMNLKAGDERRLPSEESFPALSSWINKAI